MAVDSRHIYMPRNSTIAAVCQEQQGMLPLAVHQRTSAMCPMQGTDDAEGPHIAAIRQEQQEVLPLVWLKDELERLCILMIDSRGKINITIN